MAEKQEMAEEATESPCDDKFKATGQTIRTLIVDMQTLRNSYC